MDQLTLTLHKTKDTKNKVVYGTKDGAVHPECLHRQGCSGRRSTRHASGGHIPRRKPRNSDGNPDSPQVVVFLATIVDVTVGS